MKSGVSPMAETTRLYQQIMDEELEPLPSPNPNNHQPILVPTMRNAFFGRTIEIVQTIDLLTRQQEHAPRLLTLTGPRW